MVKVIELNSDQLVHQASALYQEVWKSNYDSIKERIEKHRSYKEFRGYIALSDNDNIMGFSYGYASLPGQFYHELLAKEFNSGTYQKWLANCFELVELVVHPAYQNQGIAKLLIKKLLEDVENETAVLTTQADNIPARSLYESLHWEVIKSAFYPSDPKQRYVIMGKKL